MQLFQDPFVPAGAVGESTMFTTFYTVFQNSILPSTVLSQMIKGAIAKQAIEKVLCPGMAGEKFAVPILKILVVFHTVSSREHRLVFRNMPK